MTADDSHRLVLGGATLTWAGATDVGRVRSLNEDSFLIEPPMFVVADGMGGHEAGEVASALTVARLRGMAGEGPLTMEAVAAELRNINSLLTAASPDPDATMGTTGVGLVMVTNGGIDSWLVFNVGDSRAYCLEDGELRQISRDHSYVQELIDAGELDPEDRGRHPHRNVVTRALGVDEELQADYSIRPLRPAERFLLCSDGLSGEVDDADLAAILAAGEPAALTVASLVDRALAAGGRDNVTAVVVDVISVLGWDEATTGERPGPSGTRAASLVEEEVDLDTLDRTLPHGPPPAPPAYDPPRATGRVAPTVDDAPPGTDDLIDRVPPVTALVDTPTSELGRDVGADATIAEVPRSHDDADPSSGARPAGPAVPLIGSMPSHLASTSDEADRPAGPTTAPVGPPPAPDGDPEQSSDGP